MVSCQRRRLAKMASLLFISPSPFPPFSSLSYSARPRNPFCAADGGCGVKLPNSSPTLSTVPLSLRSRASQASSEPTAVQDNSSFVPSALMSNKTPPFPFVRLSPLPATSMTTGEAGTQPHVAVLYTYPVVHMGRSTGHSHLPVEGLISLGLGQHALVAGTISIVPHNT